MATITPLAPSLDLPDTHTMLGWPHEGTCDCGAKAALLFCTLNGASYECRGTPDDPTTSAYGDDRCGKVFDVKREGT